MAEELSYVLITPYTIMKSRTGGVIARLLSRTDLELVGAQIIAPDQEVTEKYASSVEKSLLSKGDKTFAKVLGDYIRENFPPMPNGRRERVMLLLFRGENACEKLYNIVGRLSMRTKRDVVTGETIRDTYADLVTNRNGEISYFEPAVLTPPNYESALEKLKIFAEFAGTQTNIVESSTKDDSTSLERTLVIIKPDNWRHPSTKPGNIIDMLSRTGLRIIGCKIYQMSVAEGLEFYGPVRDVLRRKLSPIIGKKAKELLESELELKFEDKTEERLTEIAGIPYADDQFFRIVEFMSGVRPDKCTCDRMNSPGLVKCMVLIYEGKHAIKKIRDVLGPTDPTKAPGGTIRRDFGQDVMVNTAHASDAPESVVREMGIVNIKVNNVANIIKEFLSKKGYN
ncbi:MAG: nucleoside-diphosphate kinase [Lentisphaerae bacterium GWF2_52_8]|nr:MAG: nucleoside-diphosphate kinase [Lentisphaerae bacterium GWF2_52_8]